jgi:NhaP-type Na+/H+ and K+/H+ antiporter
MARRSLRRLGNLLLLPSGLTGAFLGVVILAQEPGAASRVAGLFVGWLYGIAVYGLIRCFRVIPGMYPLVGFMAGPVPFALLCGSMSADERGSGLVATAFLGLLVGCVEWAHVRQAERQARLADSSRP